MGTRIKLDAAIYWLLYGIVRVLIRVLCRCHVNGKEHVPAEGPLLIVANHMSWVDPLLIGSLLSRRAWFFTKIEIFRWPVTGWLCYLTGQIPVQRGESDRTALEKALAILRAGKVVVIFPEGTVERQERMLKAHTGAAMLALRTGATILPVALTGTRRILRPGRGWFPRVTVQFGVPFAPPTLNGVARKTGLQQITQEVMSQIACMLPPEQRGVYE